MRHNFGRITMLLSRVRHGLMARPSHGGAVQDALGLEDVELGWAREGHEY